MSQSEIAKRVAGFRCRCGPADKHYLSCTKCTAQHMYELLERIWLKYQNGENIGIWAYSADSLEERLLHWKREAENA